MLKSLYFVENIGRDGEIRTRDPLNPIQVRYQAAPRPDSLLRRLPSITESRSDSGAVQ